MNTRPNNCTFSRRPLTQDCLVIRSSQSQIACPRLCTIWNLWWMWNTIWDFGGQQLDGPALRCSEDYRCNVEFFDHSGDGTRAREDCGCVLGNHDKKRWIGQCSDSPRYISRGHQTLSIPGIVSGVMRPTWADFGSKIWKKSLMVHPGGLMFDLSDNRRKLHGSYRFTNWISNLSSHLGFAEKGKFFLNREHKVRYEGYAFYHSSPPHLSPVIR